MEVGDVLRWGTINEASSKNKKRANPPSDPSSSSSSACSDSEHSNRDGSEEAETKEAAQKSEQEQGGPKLAEEDLDWTGSSVRAAETVWKMATIQLEQSLQQLDLLSAQVRLGVDLGVPGSTGVTTKAATAVRSASNGTD